MITRVFTPKKHLNDTTHRPYGYYTIIITTQGPPVLQRYVGQEIILGPSYQIISGSNP